ncbi:MAG TPA: hypothetical protein VKG05_16990 [Steroidobacteraceae bacterium]|nr:hypothetical protein [Steroidobacteraceae bacterium]
MTGFGGIRSQFLQEAASDHAMRAAQGIGWNRLQRLRAMDVMKIREIAATPGYCMGLNTLDREPAERSSLLVVKP